jgi:uncharacterized lipoprotein YddW (UPF0748 family)
MPDPIPPPKAATTFDIYKTCSLVYPQTVRFVFAWPKALLLALVATEPLLPPSPASGSEFRGLWVDAFGPGFFDAEQARKLASDCRKYNFNAVIVQMRRRGDAFYNSNCDPRTTSISTNFDALAEIIKECHTGTPRIGVHCWVVSHYIWSANKPPPQPNHTFNRHPEYLTKDSIGQKHIAKGWFLDPGNPDANLTICHMAKDIVSRYDIDGLHWDYCRYPNQDSGYNETAIKRFNEEFGLKGQPAPNDPKFCEWRRRQVTDFLRRVDADLWEIKPNLLISISVFANLHDSYGYRFADWAEWNKEGIIDACIPMDFSPDNANIFFPRVDAALKHQGTRHVYIGQGAYLNTKENTLTQLSYAREKGLPGVVFYDYRHASKAETDQADTLGFVKEHFQPLWTDTPILPWKKTLGIIKGTVAKATGAPVYNATVSINTRPPRVQKTEPQGAYAFFDLTPGSYNLRVEAGELGTATGQVEAKPGRAVNLPLTMQR